MKKSELKQIIKEEITKIQLETKQKYQGIELQGFDLAQAYKTKKWHDIEDALEGYSGAKALIEELKSKALVMEIDLDNTEFKASFKDPDDFESAIDHMWQTPHSISELNELDTKLAKIFISKGFTYWTLLPVDYNRGDDYCNLALSKDKDLLSIMTGE